jgi:hypothetical protein
MSGNRKLSYPGWGTPAYPGENPHQLDRNEAVEDSYRMPPPSQSFAWVLAGKSLVVVDSDRVDNAFSALGVTKEHNGPFAVGAVDISHRWTTTFVVKEANIDLDTLYKEFQRWAKNPVINFEPFPHHLYVSAVKDKNGIPLPMGMSRVSADPGAGKSYPNKLYVNTDDDLLHNDSQIWNEEQGKFPGKGDMRANDQRLTDDTYGCEECDEVFDAYNEYLLHRTHDHKKQDPTGPEYEIREKGGIAGMDYDNEASRSNGRFFEASADLIGPIPFSFDVEDDRMYVGEPGDERVKIDQHNPFGRAEGYYTPDGDLLITTQSNVPYTIRHLMNLWEDMHPEYEVKHVYLIEQRQNRSIKEKVARA